MSIITILLIIVIAFLVGVEGILDEFQIHQPLVACTLVGLVSGHVREGLILGGSLQMITLGWANIGASVVPDVALASIASSIVMVLGLEGGAMDANNAIHTAIAIAIPLSLLGLLLTTKCRNIAIGFVHHMDEEAEKGNMRNVELWHITGIAMQGLRIMIPAIILCLIPCSFVGDTLNMMPSWLVGGIGVGAGMVSAVGYAIVFHILGTKEIWPFFFLGFILAGLADLTIIALSGIGFCLALLYVHATEKKENEQQDNNASSDPLGDILNDY